VRFLPSLPTASAFNLRSARDERNSRSYRSCCCDVQWNMTMRLSQHGVVRRTVRHPHPPTEMLLPFVRWLYGTPSPRHPAIRPAA
jgi:hypothetical protein